MPCVDDGFLWFGSGKFARRWVEKQCQLEVTMDMNDFKIDQKFDRVVSVEMFEHMRNYKKLYAMIGELLNPGGRFFKHIFVHRSVPYEFIV